MYGNAIFNQGAAGNREIDGGTPIQIVGQGFDTAGSGPGRLRVNADEADVEICRFP